MNDQALPGDFTIGEDEGVYRWLKCGACAAATVRRLSGAHGNNGKVVITSF